MVAGPPFVQQQRRLELDFDVLHWLVIPLSSIALGLLDTGNATRLSILLAELASSGVCCLPSGVDRAKSRLLDDQRADVLYLEPAVVARTNTVCLY